MNRQPFDDEPFGDERLHRYHDGELSGAERAELAERLDDAQASMARDKLLALDELGGLVRDSVAAMSAEAPAFDVWAALRPRLDEARVERGPAGGRIIELASRRQRRSGWRMPLWISSAAATAAVLLVVLLPGPQRLLRQMVTATPSNGCEIESVEVTGASVTVMQVDEGQGRDPATVVWLDEDTP